MCLNTVFCVKYHCLRRFSYIRNVFSYTWRHHMLRACDVTCDIIMLVENADPGPEMILRTHRMCSLTPYWYSCFCCFVSFCFLIDHLFSFLFFFFNLDTHCFALFCFVALPCVLHRYRCGIIMGHEEEIMQPISNFYHQIGRQKRTSFAPIFATICVTSFIFIAVTTNERQDLSIYPPLDCFSVFLDWY